MNENQNFLNLFSLNNLAMLADWLDETGEMRQYIGDPKDHYELRRELIDVYGELVAVGIEPDFGQTDQDRCVLTVSVLHANQFQIQRSHDVYLPYDQDPQRYQWIADLWQE